MSKKSPLNMNMNLVRGAAQIAKTEGSADLALSKGATETAAFLAQGIGAVVQKRNKEFNAIMKQQLGKEGLTDEEYNKLYKRFQERRGAYVYLNKKERMDFERDLLKEAEEKKKNDADREEIADLVSDEDNEVDTEQIDDSTIQDIVTGKIEPTKDDKGRVGYALSSDALQEFVIKDENGNNRLKSYRGSWEDDRFTVSEDGTTKTDKFGNTYSNDEAGFRDFQRSAKLYWIRKAKETGDKLLMYNSTSGKREYLTPEEAEALLQDEQKFVTVDEIKDHVKSRQKDNQSSQSLNTNIMNGSQKAQNLKTGDSLDFDREEARSRYNKLIDQAPDMHKLATQVMVGSTSFEQDLTEKLTTMKYGDLGISDEVVNQLDPTDDGQISSSDASVIVDGIMQDENMLRGYLTDYFTIYEEREFKANIPTELKDQANEDEFA
tara:strand:- start:12708 stop:14012 length:1305 start_codon:yes stop_codon:yes gene_type:complete